MQYDSKQDTLEHIKNVISFLNIFIEDLKKRSYVHDKSKLENPEKEAFDIYTPKLKNMKYDSPEYYRTMKEESFQQALKHHYENNSHHPEYYGEKGILGMDLLDLIEMLADWKASTLRNKDGDIIKSIEVNQKRFNYSDELKEILTNTVKKYF